MRMPLGVFDGAHMSQLEDDTMPMLVAGDRKTTPYAATMVAEIIYSTIYRLIIIYHYI